MFDSNKKRRVIKNMMLSALFLVNYSYLSAQQPQNFRPRYDNCLDSLRLILRENSEFKKAVFLTENCYITDMDFHQFDLYIKKLCGIAKAWQVANPIANYKFSDSTNFWRNFAIFRLMKDTIRFVDSNEQIYNLLPYIYDFNDFAGKEDWTNMFVTKLLATHKGNCHSLPYLYKILADELGASCWLALSPNHTYISNRCRKIGWYNTELTSGCFPIDAWIMASGYLPLKAVQSGIYMDTLSNQQSIALCVLDLGKGYEHMTHNYTDGFILRCCELSLEYFPLNVQAMLLKAETLKHIYEIQKVAKPQSAKRTFSEMQSIYLKLFDLGYREMPDQMYVQWLQSVEKEQDKYLNKKMNQIVPSGR